MPDFHYRDALTPEKQKWLRENISSFPYKLAYFYKAGYRPHMYQMAFHTARNEETGNLCRFRHLVAGRRGGKTKSAAHELAMYADQPFIFHMDAHGEENNEPLWTWVLTRTHKAGRPTLIMFHKALKEHGLIKDKDYKFNKNELTFEFKSESLVEFKSADDPDSLRGAGLDMLWVDEAGFIPNKEAWETIFPALSDKEGLGIFTTTPKGRNWYYEEFFNEEALKDPEEFRVEYMSIHNPAFPRAQWEYAKRRYHPLMFKQEYMASFDALIGVSLSGDWLQYYTLPDFQEVRKSLKVYMGVDPSISGKGDRFVITIIGVDESVGRVYLIDQYADRIPFPEQVDKIKEYWLKYSPVLIGIESNAYQAALVQQTSRIDGLPPITAMLSKGKKEERIMAMSPLFKIGKVLLRPSHKDFIHEWTSYDANDPKNCKDDCLDSMEIALRTAGVLLTPLANDEDDMAVLMRELGMVPHSTIEDLARRHRGSFQLPKRIMDVHLGEDY